MKRPLVQVDKSHGVVRHVEREVQDWAVSSSQLSRQFMVKHVSICYAVLRCATYMGTGPCVPSVLCAVLC